MRTATIALVTALALTPQAQAGDDCPDRTWENLRAENASIMASVLPAATVTETLPVARNAEGIVLWSAADPYGRLSQDDLAQIRSVQPQGNKVIYCLTGQPRPLAN